MDTSTSTTSTTSRKTEVTKIITVTLDKIHESKRVKSGPNLRKSLLVASVLHKARDVYVTEVRKRPVERVATPVTESNSEPQPNVPVPAKIKRRFTSQNSVVENNCDMEEQSSNDSVVQTEESNDTDSLPQSSSACRFSRSSSLQEAESKSLVTNILDELATESETETSNVIIDKENNPPFSEKTASEDESSTTVKVELEKNLTSCGRCLKRRTSIHYDSDNNDSFNNQTNTLVPAKRLRMTAVDGFDSTNSSPSPNCSSNIIRMDTSQINSLVKIFSQSFPELTTTDLTDPSPYVNSTEINTFALCRDSITLTA